MKKKGFTLVEVLLVIIIIGILAAITLPRILYTQKEARQAACDANVSAINSQLELWNLREGAYPSPLASLFASEDYFPEGAPECPFESPYVLQGPPINRVTKHSH